MEDFASRIRLFASSLWDALPKDIDEDKRLEIWFNLILVKFGQKPSTLIDNYDIGKLLLENPTFMKFIKTDPTLKLEELNTENSFQVWIYNKWYESLFQQKDISHMSDEMNANIRGMRLGLPCSGSFFTVQLEERIPHLVIDLSFNDILFYGYYCEITTTNMQNGLSKWLQFKPFADALGLTLVFSMYVEM